ncbi:MAG: hypothetical protein RAP03_14960 [Candidatus Electryonea clarkiae]|nr:hypothetical protein [Candidatus Electryonea clarkiae]
MKKTQCGSGESGEKRVKAKELFRQPVISDKELVMRFCWGFGRSERDRYYYYVSLLLIETGMHLQDLLKVTITHVKNRAFINQYPHLDSRLINWLMRYSEKRNCCYLLAKRCRKSYTYFFKKMMRRSGKVAALRRIVPLLKKKK